MHIIKSLSEMNMEVPTVVALGNFEGVHIGHAKVLSRAVRMAADKGAVPICLTFSNHPRNLIGGVDDSRVRLICTNEEKLAQIAAQGIVLCYEIPFDREIMHMSPRDFVQDVLKDSLYAVGVCCGFNYRFGSGAYGDAELMKSLGRDLGFDVHVSEPVEVRGETVSSTAIRELIGDGNMELCSEYLGRPYQLTGTIVRGNGIGHKYGVPTANFVAERSLQLPPNGVYYSKTLIDDKLYASVTNIGIKPTFGKHAKSVETNVLNFNGDLYGKEITVLLLKWARPELKFNSVQELVNQIRIDAHNAAVYNGCI